ncbi:hypothetical protein [Streptomyces sp. NPDC001658]
MAAQLSSTVYVRDPDTRQTVELADGTSPEPRLAALVTNPAAWVDGKLPRLPKAKTDSQPPGAGQTPPGDGPDDASGDNSAGSGAGSQSSDDDQDAAAAATQTAAKKTAARKPARGRGAADQGDSGA